MFRIAVGLASVLACATACGNANEDASQAQPAPTSTQSPPSAPRSSAPPSCKRVGLVVEGTLLLCWRPNRGERGRFLVETTEGRTALRVRPPGTLAGHWDWAALSADGTRILAQWYAECETPFAFLIPATGGRPRVVTGERDWAKSPLSTALGWTTDGRAIVFIPRQSPCGSGLPEAGVYLFRGPGDGELVRAADRRLPPINRSLRPRPVSALVP